MSRIRELIHEGRLNPLVRRTAANVIESAGVAPRDQRGEAEALFEFVRSSLRYTRDPVGIEQLTTAEGLIRDHHDADCDEYVTLLCALCMAVGIKCRLVVARKGSRGPWQHIYAQLAINGQWVSADATHPYNPLGWTPRSGDARIIPLTGNFEEQDLGIIGDIVGGILSYQMAKKNQKAQEKALDKQVKAQKKIAENEIKVANETAAAEQKRADALAQGQLIIDAQAKAAQVAADSKKILGIDWSRLPSWAPYAAAGLGALLVVRLLR